MHKPAAHLVHMNISLLQDSHSAPNVFAPSISIRVVCTLSAVNQAESLNVLLHSVRMACVQTTHEICIRMLLCYKLR